MSSPQHLPTPVPIRWPGVAVLCVLLAAVLALIVQTPQARWGGLATVLVLYAGMYWVGVRAARQSASGSFRDMALAGRRLGLGVGVFTMTATWVDGGYVNGTAEATYGSGLVHVQAPWGYALSLVLGGLFFAPRMRRHGFTTLLDPFERRFGKRAAALLYVPALTGEVFWTAAVLMALGTTFGLLLDLDVTWSIVLSAAVVVAYTMTGGLWSVAITDVAQLVILVGGLWLVVPFVAQAAGGLPVAWTAYQQTFAGTNVSVNWWAWSDTALLLVLGGIPWHVYFQRVLASRDERTARSLSLLAAGCCLIAAVPPVLIGICARAVDWGARGLAEPDAAQVLPYVLLHIVPPVVSAVGLGAVAAAIMSSVDSSILSASTMAAWNVYRPLARPDASASQLTRVVKRIIVVVGVAATLLALRVESIYALWVLCSDLVYCVLFPQLVLVLWDPRANRIGCYAGLIVSAVIRVSAGEPLLGLPRLLPLPVDDAGVAMVPFRTTAMLAGLVTIWAISRLSSDRCPPLPLDGSGSPPSFAL
jgi:solute carrier family 5 (high affinity choline transporter), member 7